MGKSKRAIACLLLALTASGTTAQAHAKLDHASPAAGSTIGSSPNEVTLYFTESLEPKFSGAEVLSSAGTRMDGGSSASGNTLRIGVKSLSPGAYTVNWHVLSVDTHKTHGSFSFHVGN
ncbi:MAG TPA: copper resistance protein CopC [Schlesneria sp.]